MASEAEAQAGTNNTKLMTPLRTKQGALALVLDEDNMATDSATQPPSQQSVKAYVNTYVDGTWADYSGTSDITGWEAFTAKQIYYKKVGKTVFVAFGIQGTSNAASANFTLPYTASNTVDNFAIGIAIEGAGAQAAGTIWVPKNSDTVSAFKSIVTSNNWATSGNKYIVGQFFYESA